MDIYHHERLVDDVEFGPSSDVTKFKASGASELYSVICCGYWGAVWNDRAFIAPAFVLDVPELRQLVEEKIFGSWTDFTYTEYEEYSGTVSMDVIRARHASGVYNTLYLYTVRNGSISFDEVEIDG